MGSCNYYIKAYFSYVEDADEAYDGIREFIKEGINAGDWWQEHRDCKNCDEFWKHFVTKFPNIAKTIPDKIGGDCDNALAGVLNYGNYVEDVEYNYQKDREVIRYTAYVWHFSNWDRFAHALRTQFGASQVTWISEEYLDPFDTI